MPPNSAHSRSATSTGGAASPLAPHHRHTFSRPLHPPLSSASTSTGDSSSVSSHHSRQVGQPAQGSMGSSFSHASSSAIVPQPEPAVSRSPLALPPGHGACMATAGYDAAPTEAQVAPVRSKAAPYRSTAQAPELATPRKPKRSSPYSRLYPGPTAPTPAFPLSTTYPNGGHARHVGPPYGRPPGSADLGAHQLSSGAHPETERKPVHHPAASKRSHTAFPAQPVETGSRSNSPKTDKTFPDTEHRRSAGLPTRPIGHRSSLADLPKPSVALPAQPARLSKRTGTRVPPPRPRPPTSSLRLSSSPAPPPRAPGAATLTFHTSRTRQEYDMQRHINAVAARVDAQKLLQAAETFGKLHRLESYGATAKEQVRAAIAQRGGGQMSDIRPKAEVGAGRGLERAHEEGSSRPIPSLSSASVASGARALKAYENGVIGEFGPVQGRLKTKWEVNKADVVAPCTAPILSGAAFGTPARTIEPLTASRPIPKQPQRATPRRSHTTFPPDTSIPASSSTKRPPSEDVEALAARLPKAERSGSEHPTKRRKGDSWASRGWVIDFDLTADWDTDVEVVQPLDRTSVSGRPRSRAMTSVSRGMKTERGAQRSTSNRSAGSRTDPIEVSDSSDEERVMVRKPSAKPGSHKQSHHAYEFERRDMDEGDLLARDLPMVHDTERKSDIEEIAGAIKKQGSNHGPGSNDSLFVVLPIQTDGTSVDAPPDPGEAVTTPMVEPKALSSSSSSPLAAQSAAHRRLPVDPPTAMRPPSDTMSAGLALASFTTAGPPRVTAPATAKVKVESLGSISCALTSTFKQGLAHASDEVRPATDTTLPASPATSHMPRRPIGHATETQARDAATKTSAAPHPASGDTAPEPTAVRSGERGDACHAAVTAPAPPTATTAARSSGVTSVMASAEQLLAVSELAKALPATSPTGFIPSSAVQHSQSINTHNAAVTASATLQQDRAAVQHDLPLQSASSPETLMTANGGTSTAPLHSVPTEAATRRPSLIALSQAFIPSSQQNAVDARLISHEACRVVPIPEKGLGVISSRLISAGEVIVSEKPFLRAKVVDLEKKRSRIVRSYQSWTHAKQKVFDTFIPKVNHVGRRQIDRLVDVWDTNAIPLGGPGRKATETGLFETLSRLNHSCAPNTVWRWSASEQLMYLSAYRDIPADTELTASYIDAVTSPHAKRQADLLEDFGFSCLCAACSPSAARIAASDARLVQYIQLRKSWHYKHHSASYRDWADDLPAALKDLETAERMLNEERRYDPMGDIWEARYELYVQHGDRVGALRMARRMVRHVETVCGEEAAEQWRNEGMRPEELEEWEMLL